MSMHVGRDVSYRQALDAVLRLMGASGTSWVPAVLAVLAIKPLRSTELLDAVNRAEERWGSTRRSLSPKVFRDTVRRMERAGLLIRTVTHTYPSTTWHELTPLGHSLLAILRPVAEWALSQLDLEHVQSGPASSDSA